MSSTAELYVVDVLDVCLHQCGTKRTEIQLLSDGSVRAVELPMFLPEDIPF